MYGVFGMCVSVLVCGGVCWCWVKPGADWGKKVAPGAVA